MGFSGGLVGKESTCNAEDPGNHRFNPWIRKIPWGRAWQLSPVFLSGESHEWRSLVGYSSWGHKELDMTKATEHIAHTQGINYLTYKKVLKILSGKE